MATTAEIQTRLTEAEAALHALATGQRVVDVWRDGRRVTFSQATIGQLRDYIAQLRNDLAEAQNLDAGRPRRRAIGIGWRN